MQHTDGKNSEKTKVQDGEAWVQGRLFCLGLFCFKLGNLGVCLHLAGRNPGERESMKI